MCLVPLIRSERPAPKLQGEPFILGVPRVETLYLCSVLSQSFSLLSFVPDHTVPYGTVLSRDAFPGTSCQATIGIVPPGRAGRHFATASS